MSEQDYIIVDGKKISKKEFDKLQERFDLKLTQDKDTNTFKTLPRLQG